ncbi:MAG: hypothetical protein CVV47_09260 [Spirochaetae bacterium HGW-Spirochaetae-3]|jgi:methyl-accepting chemotaxis protein|nr:MAG: hypothetical protein CVV47_09260 [Spirochaetae bacterium HGW-Spirochaetae-3]
MIASFENGNAVAQNKEQSKRSLSSVVADGRDHLTGIEGSSWTVSGRVLQIRDLTSAINGIAFQADLLSMRTAIEAVRVGDDLPTLGPGAAP